MVLRATRSGAASGASESRGDAAVESGGEGQFGAEVHRIAKCGRERLHCKGLQVAFCVSACFSRKKGLKRVAIHI